MLTGNILRAAALAVVFGTIGCAATPAPVAQAAPAQPAPAAPQPTDPQIAHIAYTAGEIDIKAARLALQRSHNRQVRAFASDMVRDHTAVNRKALTLVRKLHVTPEDNDTSRSLVQQADQTRAQLSGLRGAEFDKAYAANEVAYHQTVNGALQNTLIPAAQNAELKSLLQTGLQIFQGHQQHAEQLAASLH